HLLPDEQSRQAVEVTERFADGLVSEEVLAAACRVVAGRHCVVDSPSSNRRADANGAAWKATHASSRASPGAGIQAILALETDAAWERERVHQASLWRDIFGNPFRPSRVEAAWRTPTISQLAQAGYDERELPEGTLDPARLLILSDALDEV